MYKALLGKHMTTRYGAQLESPAAVRFREWEGDEQQLLEAFAEISPDALTMVGQANFTYSVNDFLNCGVEFPHYLYNRNGNGRWQRYDYDSGAFVELPE